MEGDEKLLALESKETLIDIIRGQCVVADQLETLVRKSRTWCVCVDPENCDQHWPDNLPTKCRAQALKLPRPDRAQA